MLSAIEARKKTQENIDCGITPELVKVNKQISEAITNGKFSTFACGSLCTETQEKLAKLGYKIKTDYPCNGVYYEISWEGNI